MINKIAKYVKNNFNDTVYSIKNFKRQPLKSLAQVCPITMVCTSIFGFVAALIIFIVKGGFSQQISTMKGDWFGQVENAFTVGTVKILVSGIVSSILLTLLLFNYTKNETRFKSTTCIVSLIVGICFSIPSAFVLGAGFDIISFSGTINDKLEWLFKQFENPQESTLVITFEILGIIGVIALILFAILMFLSKQRWMIKHCFMALVVSYVYLPSTLLFIENIIPLIIGIIGLVIIGVLIFFAFKIMISSIGEIKLDAPSKTKDCSQNTKTTPKKEEKESDGSSAQKNCAYISDYKDLLGGTKLYKKHGVLHDYIEFDNGVGQSEVCSLEMLQKGKFHIYVKFHQKSIAKYIPARFRRLSSA